MAREEPDILGSTITRVLVPKNLQAVLSVTTVSAEVLTQEHKSLKQLVSELTAVPSAQILDDAEYQQTVSLLSSEEFWTKLDAQSSVEPWPSLTPSRSPGVRYFSYLQSRILPRASAGEKQLGGCGLVEDCIASELLPDRRAMQAPFSPYPLWGLGVTETLSEFGVDPTIFFAASAIWFGALAASHHVGTVIPSLSRYEIPLGQSPATKSDTLGSLIKSAKNVAVAPLITSSTAGAVMIQGGHYLMALECMATGAASTLMFVGTISVAQLIIAKLASLRGGGA